MTYLAKRSECLTKSGSETGEWLRKGNVLEARDNLACRRDGSEVGTEAHLQVWAGLSQGRGAGVFW